jgi:hypothetical protein
MIQPAGERSCFPRVRVCACAAFARLEEKQRAGAVAALL